MTSKPNEAANTEAVVAPVVPPPVVVDDAPKAGDGEVVVTSPTGTRSVVSKNAVESLKTQGYKVS